MLFYSSVRESELERTECEKIINVTMFIRNGDIGSACVTIMEILRERIKSEGALKLLDKPKTLMSVVY